MKDQINAYAATLLITIAGAAATWLIVRTSESATLTTTIVGSEGNYSDLQKSILNN